MNSAKRILTLIAQTQRGNRKPSINRARRRGGRMEQGLIIHQALVLHRLSAGKFRKVQGWGSDVHFKSSER